MTRSRAWGPGEVSTMQRVISLTVSATGTSVSKRPGVSTTTTSLPFQVLLPFWQCLVMDTAEKLDRNTFSLRMLFPVALFPAPVLPTKTSLSWESPEFASPGTSGNRRPGVRMNFKCLPCKAPAHWINIQPWMFIGRTDAVAEAPKLWPLDAKSRLTGKDSDAGKVWRQKEKGVAEDKMARQHHQINGHEFEQTPGESGGQRNLASCSPWAWLSKWTTITDIFQDPFQLLILTLWKQTAQRGGNNVIKKRSLSCYQ